MEGAIGSQKHINESFRQKVESPTLVGLAADAKYESLSSS